MAIAGDQIYNLLITRRTLHQQLSELISTESKKCKRLWIYKACDAFSLLPLLFNRFVEVWIIRVHRYRRRRHQPWNFSPADYANRRHGLILVRRIYQWIILTQPFTCGGGSTRRRRTIGDEDSEEGGKHARFYYNRPFPRDCLFQVVASFRNTIIVNILSIF